MTSSNPLLMALGAAALALSAVTVAAQTTPQTAPQSANPAVIDLATWTVPDLAKVPDDALGKLIRYGHALTVETYKHIGPEVADPARRWAGNNLACQSCHLNAATQAYSMPWVGVHAVFPQYRGREDAVSMIEDRVNGCMERSMNGRPLPLDSTEMKAFVVYMKFLSTGIPVAAKLAGAGTKPVKDPPRPADPVRGRTVYAETCASCHGETGLGVRNGQPGDALGYQFPPLWGPDSFNDGAGMYRLLTAAAFVRHNMPLGTTAAAPLLSDEDAYDVAAFVESQDRPHKANMDRDFPNRLRKPIDMPFGPYVDGFDETQHKYGPFDPIRAKLKALQKSPAS